MKRLTTIAASLIALSCAAQTPRPLQDLTTLAAPASDDLAYIVDISAANASRKISLGALQSWWSIATTQLSGTLALANGGTGVSLSDPGADRIAFWDDSAGALAWLTAGTGLAISGTTISASGSGTVTSVAATAPGAGITISGSPITTTGTLGFSLADDLAAVEGLSSTGLVRRTGTSAWTAGTAVALASEVSGVLPVANGGTGANNAITARSSLGLAINGNVQGYSYTLELFGALTDPGGARMLTWAGGSTDNFVFTYPGAGLEIDNAGQVYVEIAASGGLDWSGGVLSTNGALSRISVYDSAYLSDCGTSPTIEGTDRRGVVTADIDAGRCQINFAAPYSSAPVCVIAQIGGYSRLYIYEVSTTELVVSGTAWAGGEVITYICEGY